MSRQKDKSVKNFYKSTIICDRPFLTVRPEKTRYDLVDRQERRRKTPIEKMTKEAAKRLGTTPDELKGPDRRWATTRNLAEAIALWVPDYGYKVTEVAKFLRGDQANVSHMLSWSATRTEREDGRD